MDGVQAGLSRYQQYFRYHGDKLRLRSSIAGNCMLRRKFTLAVVQLPLKSTGVSRRLPPKFGRAICPWGKGTSWDARSGGQIMAPSFRCKATAPQSRAGTNIRPNAAGLVLWAQGLFFEVLRLAASVQFLAQLGGGGGQSMSGIIQLVMVLVFKERDWDLIDAEAVNLMIFWSSWLGMLDSSQPWFLM